MTVNRHSEYKGNIYASKSKSFNARIITLILALTMVAGLFSSCSLTDNDSDASKEENRQKFTIGFDAGFPPYGSKDEKTCEYVGFDIDLAKEVCERNGWEFVPQPIDWDSKDMELNSGTIDCIWNGFTINGREKLYTWSKAYVDNSQVVVVKKDSKISKLSDLKGKVVEVQTDSSALAAFTGEGATEDNKALCSSFDKLVQQQDYNVAFLDLDSGVADAVCLDIGVAKYQLERSKGNYVLLDESVSTEYYGIGFKKGNIELRDKVQAALDEMNEDGTFDKIAEKWELDTFTCLGKEGTDEAYNMDQTEKAKESFVNSFVDISKKLSKGMVATLAIFALTLLFSLPLGLLIMFMRTSKATFLRLVAQLYISIMRGTPLMLQLLVVFFGPYYIFGVSMSYEYRFYAVIIGFSLNYAAYFAEIYRGGIESIPVGQHEASAVLGYSRFQKFTKIILPQMVKRVLPSVTNEVITLVKDTSLAFALAYTEMFTIAKQVAASKASILPLFIAGLFYYVFNFVVAFLMGKLEKRLSYFR